MRSRFQTRRSNAVNIVTRRQLLRSVALLAGVGAASGLLAACGQSAAPTSTAAPAAPTPAPKPTEAPKPAATTAPAAAPTTAPAPTMAPASAPTKPQAVAAPTQAAAGATMTLPRELQPGSPGHPKGWTVTLPPRPATAPSGKPPVTITASKRLSGAVKFAKGDSVENSQFTRLAKEALGIEWKIAWTWVAYDEAQQKYNLGIASGQLPDFMETVPFPVF